ncbi:hypothetical protein E4U58_006671 [Claviceps cyperi]|nr:hypothetical protein E4U58_006671 [Claviceps cyperi]
MRGGLNCHAEIKFEDGAVWLARFRILSAIAPPPEVRDYVLQSKATTMQFLERHTRVPSPRVFDWACESDPTNTIGVGYILMEKLNGRSLEWHEATAAQKEKIVRQYADIMLELERYPFDQLGSRRLRHYRHNRLGMVSNCPEGTSLFFAANDVANQCLLRWFQRAGRR